MFCSLSKRKKEPKFKMNTQFNSNVIWLQLEYKISTLEDLLSFKCSTQTSDIKQTLMPFSLHRQLFAMTGGHDSDTFKQLSAAFTVLRSLGSAQTAANRESSRIGHFIEAQVSDGELYRTKIPCYFLDQVSNLIQVFNMI